MNNEKLLEVKNLSIKFPGRRGIFSKKSEPVTAVNNVSFDVKKGDILGIAGESGSGKSTVCKAILNLIRFISPDAVTEGDIYYYGKGNSVNLIKLDKKSMRPFRKEIQMIFQDSNSSLNPRMTVYEILAEPYDIHFKDMSKNDKFDKIIHLLERVGLTKDYLNRYPHEFSGGQRQRISIARSLASSPKLLAADEPVSALDVSIQADILNLLMQLKEDEGFTYIFIAHDISVIRHVSNRILIMYLGNIVETGDTETVCQTPAHPYTRKLLASVPEINKKNFTKFELKANEEERACSERGCFYRQFCSNAKPECSELKLMLMEYSPGHMAACPFGS